MKKINIKDGNISSYLDVTLFEQDLITDTGIDLDVEMIRKKILLEGFDAVSFYSKKFDNFDLTKDNFRVSKEDIGVLSNKIDKDLSKSLEIAVDRISSYHKKQLLSDYRLVDEDNIIMGQKILPLDSVCVYVPGGRALYPSTIYMSVIPALIAGVSRIVLISPPRTFIESPEVARLIEILGINEIYRVGGAQGIFCAAYGCENFKSVDKIVGPGNAFVAKAKQKVFGRVAIDMIAGPSEILIIADTKDTKDVNVIAADLLSQAEHDPMARSIVMGMSEQFLGEVEKEVYRQAASLPEPNRSNAIKSLDDRGIIIKVNSIDDIIKTANYIASEHLEIFSDNHNEIFKSIQNAGSVFLGKWTPESIGDYIGGPNHVLPTSGTARFYSPLGVYDFQKRMSYIEFNREALLKYGHHAAKIARSEKLEAHALSCEIRYDY